MVRVVRPGGLVALYVWDYAGHMQIMRYFFDAAVESDIRTRDLDDDSLRELRRLLDAISRWNRIGAEVVRIVRIRCTDPTP